MTLVLVRAKGGIRIVGPLSDGVRSGSVREVRRVVLAEGVVVAARLMGGRTAADAGAAPWLRWASFGLRSLASCYYWMYDPSCNVLRTCPPGGPGLYQ